MYYNYVAMKCLSLLFQFYCIILYLKCLSFFFCFFFNVAVNVFMYLPMTFHLESGEFNGNVAKTSELSFVHDFSLK